MIALSVTIALSGSVMGSAYAMQDIVIENSPRSSYVPVSDAQASSDSMPDNPNAILPSTMSRNNSDTSTMVSEKLVVTPEGDVQDIETGKSVTDSQLVGTQYRQPDPLTKTNGESFIPVSVSDVKSAVEQSSLENAATVRLAKFDSNEYGAHWGTYNGTKAFFDYKNNLFAQQARGVIDVSEWQHDIDWARAKADGVEGAIIRLGYGWGNNADAKAQRNINECKRLGIPFGIYWYSYAYDANCARSEGGDVVAKLRQMGVSPNDLKYPVYYDLEQWTWLGHATPTNPTVYSDIANAWYSALQSGGYKNLGVYSYTSYLQGPLNNANIYAKTRWVAQYGARMGFTAFGTNDRGWQYTSSGQINGISGSVDMNAFGSKMVNLEVKGEIEKEWRSTGAEKGALGYPVEAETSFPDGWKSQRFQNGDIWARGSDRSFVIKRSLRDSWDSHGGFSRLGAPVANEEDMGNGYWRQRCENGDVWTRSGAWSKYAVVRSLRDSFNKNGGYHALGGPVADEEDMGNGYWRQRCENGDVWTRSGAWSKYAVVRSLRDSFNKNGGYHALGGPVADEEDMGNGYWRQRCENGYIRVHI